MLHTQTVGNRPRPLFFPLIPGMPFITFLLSTRHRFLEDEILLKVLPQTSTANFFIYFTGDGEVAKALWLVATPLILALLGLR